MPNPDTVCRAGFLTPGFGISTRRVGLTALGVKFFTLGLEFSRLGLENPGLGLEKPKPGFVTPKAGAEKKEAGLGCSSLPFAITKIGIGRRNSKSGISHLTICRNPKRWGIPGVFPGFRASGSGARLAVPHFVPSSAAPRSHSSGNRPFRTFPHLALHFLL